MDQHKYKVVFEGTVIYESAEANVTVLTAYVLSLSTNDDGDWISHKLNFETVKNSIRFIQYVRLNGTLLKIVLQPSNVKR